LSVDFADFGELDGDLDLRSFVESIIDFACNFFSLALEG
jgi:hypothetical protein